MIRSLLSLAAFSLVSLGGCSSSGTDSSTTKALPFTTAEKLADFDVAVSQFKNYYAPLQYKAEKFGTDFDAEFASLRAELEVTETDLEFQKVMRKLAAIFKDGHVSLSIPFEKRFSLPFTVDFLSGTYVVTEAEEGSGVTVGDTLVSMDGQSPEKLAEAMSPYVDNGHKPFDDRLKAFFFTHRRALLPESTRSLVKLRNKDGAEYVINSFWKHYNASVAERRHLLDPPRFPQVASSTVEGLGIKEFGATKPFFNEGLTEHKSAIAVGLSKEEWTAAVTASGKEKVPEEPAEIYSVLYRHEGKNVFLIRIPSYSVKNFEQSLITYEALLKKYAPLSDVLVIDQTHNPGGSVSYLESLVKLFLKAPGRGFAFAPRADRLWLRNLSKWLADPEWEPTDLEKSTWDAIFGDIDRANENGDFLAAPFTFSGEYALQPNNAWDKPILLLTDELCGSGGDAFPLLMQGNKRATVFGKQTAGMGGNVEEMAPLPNSGITYRMTRSLFYMAREDYTLPTEAIVENNGVKPDIEYAYTAEDKVEKFKEYINKFSDEAIKLIPAPEVTEDSAEDDSSETEAGADNSDEQPSDESSEES